MVLFFKKMSLISGAHTDSFTDFTHFHAFMSTETLVDVMGRDEDC